MNIRELINRSWFLRVAIIMWIVSSVFVALLVNRLDGIVHGTLYGYNLRFDLEWALPFWVFETMIYVCLAAPLIFSGVALVLDFWNSRKSDISPVKHVGVKPANGKVMQLKESTMLINCPKCRKVFSKPLTMLDFSSGKTKLVNVCPYCNHVLGSANEKGDTDVEVVALDEREEKVRR